MPKRAKGQSQARSRAITTEEYERALLAIPKVRPQDAAQWERYITGLWLVWSDGGLRPCLSRGTRTAFSASTLGKSGRSLSSDRKARKAAVPKRARWRRTSAAWLLAVPESERTGRVFHWSIPETKQPLSENRVGPDRGDASARPQRSRWGPGRSGDADGKAAEVPGLCRVPFLPPRLRFKMGKAGRSVRPKAADAS